MAESNFSKTYTGIGFQPFLLNIAEDAAMSAFLKREGYTCRPHGFGVAFRTWVEEQTETPFEVKESALGHTINALNWPQSLIELGIRG